MANSAHHLGLRAQLRNYFGKHATFGISVRIHELSNIPLVSGDFACRWRVKGAQPLTRQNSTSGKSGTSSSSNRDDRTGNSDDRRIEVQVQPPSPPLEPTTTRGSVAAVSLGESEWGSPSESSDGRYGSGSLQPSESSHGHDSDTEDTHQHGTSTTTLKSKNARNHLRGLGPGKGKTETVKIIDHTVVWDETVELAAHMGIAKENKALLPSELKITVEQVPQHLEHLDKPKTTLGVVRLNLAEYVDKGAVTRRYLLRDSKTNATLKLTVDIKWQSGERDYIAPPLQKAQIMEGVAGLMSNDRMMHPTRPHASMNSSSSSSFYGVSASDRASTSGLRARSPSLSRAPTLSHSLSFTRPNTPGPTGRTEQIIEALFNPVPTTNPNPSPFSYYAPGRPPIRKGTVNVSGTSELDSTWSMAKAQQDAEARGTLLQVPNGGTEVEEPESSSGGGWWKRLASGSAATVGRAGKKPEMLRRGTAV